jgi:hypothetical protein
VRFLFLFHKAMHFADLHAQKKKLKVREIQYTCTRVQLSAQKRRLPKYATGIQIPYSGTQIRTKPSCGPTERSVTRQTNQSAN